MNEIQHNICLLNGDKHACELSYQDGKWYFYDPIYETGVARIFTDCKELVAEITQVLGQSICIEQASFESISFNLFSHYSILLNAHPETLIQKDGLSLIARFNPENIFLLIEHLKKSGQYKSLNLNKTDSNGWTPLMYAARNGHPKAIRVLCAVGANPNQAGSDGFTPLMLAARNGNSEAICVLHAEGANPNQVRSDGWTALMSAAQNGHIEAAQALLDIGADPDQFIPSNGATPLMLAAQCGHTDIVNLLFEKANLDSAMNASINVLLRCAREKNREREVSDYFSKQYNSQTSIPGFTALHLAVFFGHGQIVELLLHHMNLTSIVLRELENLAQIMNHTNIEMMLKLKIQNTAIETKPLYQPELTLFNKVTSENSEAGKAIEMRQSKMPSIQGLRKHE